MTIATSYVKSMSVSAVVTRANGTVEDLGVISEWQESVWHKFWRNVERWIIRSRG